MSPLPRHRIGRVPTAAAATVALASLLSGCSALGDPFAREAQRGTTQTDSREGGTGTGLSQQQAEQALLTIEHLSPEFELDDSEDEPDDEGPDWGCLLPDGLGDEDSEPQAGDAEIAFKAKREPGMPGVLSSVFSSDGDPAQATKAMDELADSYASCKRVSTKDEDGTVWEFDVMTDTEVWAPDGDQQINVAASGSIKLDSFTVPIEVRMTVVRVDATGSMVGFFDMTEAAPAATEAQRDLVTAASARLAAVLSGEKPPAPEPLLADYAFTDLFEELLSQVDEDDEDAV